MKTMTCHQLGGACELKFQAETFDEIAEMSKQHATQMFQQHDAAHLKAMTEMQALMQQPQAMQAWFAHKRQQFEALDQDSTK